jgi:hypothetical protein
MATLRTSTSAGDKASKKIDVSIILATHNRSQRLLQTLESVARQQLADLEVEVIVIDNGSDDDTPEVLSRMQAVLPLISLHEGRRGKNRAYNRGLSVARGTLLVFTDDDIVAEANWICELHAAAQRWPLKTIFAGAIAPLFDEGIPAWIRDEAFAYRRLAFCEFRPQQHEGYIEQRAFGANWAVSKSAIAGVSFCESVGPDAGTAYIMGSETEFMQRIEKVGFQTVFVPKAYVRHVITREQALASTLRRRAFCAGRGDVYLGGVPEGRTMCGVPVVLWRWCMRSLVRFARSRVSCRRVRVEQEMELCRALGRIAQCRVMSDQRRRV